MGVPDGRTAFYRLFDSEDSLLYVGIAANRRSGRHYCAEYPRASEVELRVYEAARAFNDLYPLLAKVDDPAIDEMIYGRREEFIEAITASMNPTDGEDNDA